MSYCFHGLQKQQFGGYSTLECKEVCRDKLIKEEAHNWNVCLHLGM